MAAHDLRWVKVSEIEKSDAEMKRMFKRNKSFIEADLMKNIAVSSLMNPQKGLWVH